jgi:hypothetical protein
MYAEGAGRIDAKTETAIRKALKKGDVSINKIAPSLGTGTAQKIKAELSALIEVSRPPTEPVPSEAYEDRWRRAAPKTAGRVASSSGVEQLDRYFKQQAGQERHRHIANCFV